MDRAVFDSIEREIDDEVRARFPADVIKQAVLLHYGDESEIEPGELWLRVFLPADRPEEYEQSIRAFVTSGGHGPRCSMLVGQRVTDVREHELGEATRVDVRLGPANLEALDTLIMAGIADDRADAVRWVLARFRQQPEYEQLRERAGETGRLKAEC